MAGDAPRRAVDTLNLFLFVAVIYLLHCRFVSR